MSSVADLIDRKERPPYVRFARVAVEDKIASNREGRYIAKDVDMAFVTPPYSKDVFQAKVKDWFNTLENDLRNDRIPRKWFDDYKDAYERWKKGEELPLNGTPIKSWGVISPAQQETLIRMQVLTVEDLAAMNDEGVHRVGMGAYDMKNKAVAWLAQLKDKGPLTQEMAALKAENNVLKNSVETLTKQVEQLMIYAKQNAQQTAPPEFKEDEIQASDIIDTEDLTEQYKRKFGEPPHHRMKPETIRRALTE